MTLNKTLDYADLNDSRIQPTVASIKRWQRRWLITGGRLGVNGHVKRRLYIRRHKMWEYARGLALTNTSAPARQRGGKFTVLDVGGAMTAPVFYLAGLGDHVVCLDINKTLIDETNQIARKRGLTVDGRTTNLVDDNPSPGDLGVDEGGFDRVFSFCVIEHILPPGQATVAERMAKLLRPGGRLCLTFDYGEHAPTEAPMYSREHVQAIRDVIGLPLMGNQSMEETGRMYPLNRRYPEKQFTFGSLFFHRPSEG